MLHERALSLSPGALQCGAAASRLRHSDEGATRALCSPQLLLLLLARGGEGARAGCAVVQ
jgi:hypothetical protein